MSPIALRGCVIFGGAALIFLIIGADTYEGWQDYRAAIAQNEQSAQALAEALAEQTNLQMARVERLLLASANLSEHSRLPPTPPLEASLRGPTDDYGAGSPARDSIAFLDASGVVVDGTASGWRPDAQTAKAVVAAHLSEQAKRPEVAFSPFLSSERTLAIVASYPLRDSTGQLTGLAASLRPLRYVEQLYNAANVVPETAICLVRSDGVTVVRYPPSGASACGSCITGGSITEVAKCTAGSGWQITAIVPVRGFPMSIQVMQPMHRVLAYWRQEETASAIRTGCLTALAMALIAALALELRRREVADQERLRLERQLARTQQAETLGMFAATIAHDFNNVLGAIVGYGELARDTVSADPSARANIERLLAASERARALVRRVLTFDLHRGTRVTSIDLNSVASEVVANTRVTLSAQVALTIRCQSPEPVIRGDALEVHQVVSNLCSNAARAAAQTIELQTTVLLIEAPRRLTVGELTPGAWVCLSVTDDGEGMPASLIETIFQPFSTTKQADQVAGLGLAVVANIVTSMGGAIEVISQPGRGATFSIYWPDGSTTVERMGTPSAATCTGRGEIVMIVDDDPVLVEVVEELLAALGYEPVGFTDPFRAIQTLKEHPLDFDAIITDEHMPGMRGTQLAQEAHRVRAGLPIVLATGHRDPALNTRAAESNVLEILDKPLKREQLQQVLARMFPLSQG